MFFSMGGAGQQQLEGVSGDPLEGLGLLVVLLVDWREGIGFLEYRQIPVNYLCGLLIVGGEVVGSNNNGILDKSVGVVLTGVLPPLVPIGQHHIWDGIESLQHFRPLVQQVDIGNDQQNPAVSLQPLLIDDQHGLVALAHTCFIAQNGTFLIGGTQGKAGRCNLKRIDFNIR